MSALKYSWYKATNKDGKYFYRISIDGKEVYKSGLFATQQEAKDAAADTVSFYWLGGKGQEAYCEIIGNSITFIFKETPCQNENVN